MSTVVEFQTREEKHTEWLTRRILDLVNDNEIRLVLDSLLAATGMVIASYAENQPDTDVGAEAVAMAESFGDCLVSGVMAMLASNDGEEFPAN